MDAIAKIRAKLANYPELRHTATSSSIRVEPADDSGFEVSLHVAADEFVVHFDGWHEHFDSEGEALKCFFFGLSDSCRLAVTYRGSMPTKWVVQSLQSDSWNPVGETGLLLFPFWLRSRVVYKRNRLLPAT